MPALPEIEVVRRDLEREVVGRRFKDVAVRPGSNAMKLIKRHGRRKEFADLLSGARVERVDRIGRRLALYLDNQRVLVFDLGETARLVKTSSSDVVAPHTHLVFGFTIGGQLRLIDPKLSGEVFVVDRADFEALPEARARSLDPLETPLAWQHFSSLLGRRDVPLKELLLDDGFICGLGPIYSDEILFMAGLRHDRPANRLSSQDVRRLYRALTEILQDAVKARGTSSGDLAFTDLQGNRGQYQLELKVYERAGEPCRRCRHAIARQSLDGAGYTYFCPQCQS